MSRDQSKESNEFDCSAYLSHGLRWPGKECYELYHRRPSVNVQNVFERWSKYTKRRTKSSVRDWGVLLREQMKATTQKQQALLVQKEARASTRSWDKETAENLQEKQYYESEYNTLLKWMDQGEIIVPPPSMFADKREEIQQISLVADEALGTIFRNYTPDCFNEQVADYTSETIAHEVALRAIETPREAEIEVQHASVEDYNSEEARISCEDLAKDIATRGLETPRISSEVMSAGGLQSSIEEQLSGFGQEVEKKNCSFAKRHLCRYFVKGLCVRADSCEFLHDQSIYCMDEQKVFLGGLPLHITSVILKAKLEEQGLTVLNKPRIMRGFCPEVCLGSVDQAKRLIAQRFLYIANYRLDVRPYQDKQELRQGLRGMVKRSVFLGGLPENTTGKMVITDLKRLDVSVVNYPVVKNGYAQRVVLDSVKHAKKLVALKRVLVNGIAVDVRPYVNFRKRY